MIKILRRIFETDPEKSTIILKEKCSGCGRQTIIEITPTSGGFGLQGGYLFKSSTVKYKVKCPACIEATPNIDDNT